MRQCIKLLICILTLCAHTLVAQTFEFKTTKFSEGKDFVDLFGAGAQQTITVEHDKWAFISNTANSNWGNDLKFKSLHNFVHLYIDYGNLDIVNQSYRYLIPYELKGYTDPYNPLTLTTLNDTVVVSYNKDSLKAFQDKFHKKYSGFHKMEVTIDTNNIYKWDGSTYIPVHTGNADGLNCRIEAEVWAQYYDKRYYGNSNMPALDILTDASNVNSKGELIVSWTCPSSTYDMVYPCSFELEWTYIDNYHYDFGTNTSSNITNPSQLSYNFKHNSNRISTKDSSFTIPVVYDKGYLAYRVRMIRPDSVNYILPIYGQWSEADHDDVLGNMLPNHFYQIANPFEGDSLNWNYNISFAEDGKYKHVVSFYDGLLYNKQSITKINSDDSNFVATKSIYDYQGRPAIQLLPIPVRKEKFSYIKNLANHSVTNDIYRAYHFDSIATNSFCTPPALDSLSATSLAYKYYSPSNSNQSAYHKFIPDAQGYPFVHTYISPEDGSKPFAQGGAGKPLQIDKGHASWFSYTAGLQEDINKLFGSEIGYEDFYQNSYSTDPNGQTSLSVNDNEGRVIMTSLLGRIDTADLAIDTMDLPSIHTYTKQFITPTNQTITANERRLNKTFFNDAAGNNAVNYSASYIPYNTNCPNKYLTIGLKYRYEILDNCYNILDSASSVLGTSGVVSNGSLITSSVPSSSPYMPKGDYTLNKILSIDDFEVEKVVDSFLSVADDCFYDEEYFIRNEVEAKEFPCPTDTTSPCDIFKLTMLEELYPGKKYGQYNGGTGTGLNALTTGDANSIFTSLNPKGHPQEFRYQDPCITPRMPDTVWYNNIAYTQVQTLHVDTFIMIFNDSIAEALLPLHPEYCKLVQCYDQDDLFADTLSGIASMQDGIQMGLFSLNDIANADPLVISNVLPIDSLLKFNSTNSRLDSLALITAYCGGLNTAINNTSLDIIYNSILNSTTPFSIADNEPLVKAFYYETLIGMYLANRETHKQKLIDGINSSGCGPCQTIRMTLIPDPVFPATPPLGGTNSNNDSLNNYATNNGWGNLNGLPDLPDWLLQDLTNGNPSSTTLDSINAYQQAQQSAICEVKINGLMSKFKNCTTNSSSLSDLKDSLTQAFCVNGEAWSPDRVKLMLVNCGLSLNDICHQYLVGYEDMPSFKISSDYLMCKSDKFYDDALSFFNQTSIKSILNSSGSTNYTLSSLNLFEQELINASGSISNVAVQASYNSTADQYEISITNLTNSNVVNFWLSNAVTNMLATDPNFNFTALNCIVDYSSIVLPTHINFYTFHIAANGTFGDRDLLGYNDGIQLINEAPDQLASIANATACIEIKPLYEEVKIELDNLGIYAGHQDFLRAVTNHINYKLSKHYSQHEVVEFMKSCAYSDSTKQIVTTANWELNCTNANSADAVINSISNFLGYMPTFHREANGTQEIILLSYLDMWDDSTYLLLNNHIASLSSTNVVSKIYNRTYGQDTLAIVYVPVGSTLDPLLIANLPHASDITVSTGTIREIYTSLFSKSDFKRYVLTLTNGSNSTSSYSIARNSDSLIRFVVNTDQMSVVLPNYVGIQNEDYYLIEKQQWLQHNYNTQFTSHDSLLLRLTIDSLKLNMPSVTGKNISYGNPLYRNKDDALNISDPSLYSANTGYQTLVAFLDCIQAEMSTMTSYPTSNGFLFNEDSIVVPILSAHSTLLNAGASASMKVFKCGSYKPNTYFVRYFDQDDNLLTAFYEVPRGIQDPHTLKSAANSLIIGPGDGSTYRFSFQANYPSSSTNNGDYQIRGYTNFSLGNTLHLQYSLLRQKIFSSDAVWDTTSCESQLMDIAIDEGRWKYAQYIDSIKNFYVLDFKEHLKTSITESLTIELKDLKYYYTLYYYDKAGNLTRTVPPGGVNQLANGSAQMTAINNDRDGNIVNTANIPAHNKVTNYKYNSFNQLFEQSTPDGGVSKFWYDGLGRIVFSQNAKQALTSEYSYTMYDDLSRIIEVGKLRAASSQNEIVNSMYIQPDFVQSFILNQSRSEVVSTLYDNEGLDLSVFTNLSSQRNLRNRVSASKYFPLLTAQRVGDTSKNYNFATYYSYDVLGNVATLTHDFRELLSGKQRFKRVDYDYDLQSGKVNMVSYNRGFADQFYQKYDYDADNRITKAESSKDGVYWDKDASYEYYAHGPLARMIIGDLNIQGVDYAYTIQGWLKAINTDMLDSTKDMGNDGLPNSAVLKDAFAMTLDYFNNEYKSISNESVTQIPTGTKNLYNGNISRQNVSLSPFKGLSKNYKYDPLNRILKADYFTIADDGTNINLINTKEYRERFKYDLDGNILSLSRYGDSVNSGAPILMDSMQYFYSADGVNTYNNAIPSVDDNRLNNVYDFANHSNNYTNDIQYYPTTAVNTANPVGERYAYDAIGNLVQDQMNGIDQIDWNLYGKVSSVSLPNNRNSSFTYSPSGERISKMYQYYKGEFNDTLVQEMDIYVRDASGNILAILKKEKEIKVEDVRPIKFATIVAQTISGNGGNIIVTQIGNAYSLNGKFASSLKTQVVNSPALSISIIDSTSASTYMGANTALLAQTLEATTSTMIPFLDSNKAMIKQGVKEGSTTDLVNNLTVADSNENHTRVALLNMHNTNAYSLENMIVRFYGLEYDEEDLGANISTLINQYLENVDEFQLALNQTIDNTNEAPELEGFKDAFIDQLLDDNDYYLNSTGGAFDKTHTFMVNAFMSQNYNPAGEQMLLNEVISTIDQNNSTFHQALKSNNPNGALIDINYSLDPMDVIGKANANLGGISLGTAIDAMRGITWQGLLRDVPAMGYAQLTQTYTLLKEHTWLAEHHLYGSSRLGIKEYLPNQYEENWFKDQPNSPVDSATLNYSHVWFNHDVNEFIDLETPDYNSYQDIDNSNWLAYRIIGLKNYELTNHLGNVQTTLLDKFTPAVSSTTNTAYDLFNANISSASDYYPFGSLMPGRYTHDTVSQSINVISPFNQIVHNKVDSVLYNFPSENFVLKHTPFISVPNSNVAPLIMGTPVKFIECSINQPSSVPQDVGMETDFTGLTVGQLYRLFLEVEIASSGNTTYAIEHLDNGNNIIYNINFTASGTYDISFIAANATEKIRILAKSVANNSASDFKLKSLSLVEENTTTINIATTIQSKTSDDFRFGFQGQEKDNEIKGIGNSVNYKYRMHDARLGRFFAVDPLTSDYPHNSPYAFSENNVIHAIELEGLEKLELNAERRDFEDSRTKLVIVEHRKVVAKRVKQVVKTLKGISGYDQGEAEAMEILVAYNKSKKSGDNTYDRWVGIGGIQARHARREYNQAGGVGSKGKAGAKVDLMGGAKSRYRNKGFVNFDKNAKVGVKSGVTNFKEYYGVNSVAEMIVDNPQANFLGAVTSSMETGGTITIRGGMANKYFRDIYNGKTKALKNYSVVSKKVGVNNPGYKRTDGSSIDSRTEFNEIILKKNE